jgi:hypothetical protein
LRTYLELLDVVKAASWVGDVDVAGVVDVAAGVGGDFADSHYCNCQLEVVVEDGRSGVCTLGDRVSDCKVGLGVADEGH